MQGRYRSECFRADVTTFDEVLAVRYYSAVKKKSEETACHTETKQLVRWCAFQVGGLGERDNRYDVRKRY